MEEPMSLMERRRHRDLVIEWLRESYFIGHSGSLAKAAVYKEYLGMCRHLQLTPLSSPAFGKIVHKGKDISFASPLLPQLHKQIRPESLPPPPRVKRIQTLLTALWATVVLIVANL